MKLFVGIDVSSKDLQVVALDSEDQNKRLINDSFVNDLYGASELKKQILDLAQNKHYDQIIIGMEATSIYSFHPAYFFQNDEDLQKLNVETDVINPKETSRFHKVFEESKTDPLDAYYIALYLSFGHYRVSIARQDNYLALERLTRTRYELVQELTRTKQHFIEALYYRVNKLITVDKDKINTPLFGATMMSIVTDSKTLDEIADMPTEDLISYLQVKGRGRFSDPDTLAKAIKKAVRGSYRLGKVMTDSIDAVFSVHYNMIQSFNESIKDLEKAIDRIVDALPESKILESIPGIGKTYTAGIIAEIGSIDRFDKEEQLAKYAGLTWNQYQSGDHSNEHTPMARTGNRYLRYYLIEAANLARLHDPVFKKYYQKKYDEAVYSPHKRACTLTARKLVRVIFKLLKDDKLYRTPRS